MTCRSPPYRHQACPAAPLPRSSGPACPRRGPARRGRLPGNKAHATNELDRNRSTKTSERPRGRASGGEARGERGMIAGVLFPLECGNPVSSRIRAASMGGETVLIGVRGSRRKSPTPHAPRPPRCQGATMIHSRRRHGEEEQRGQRGCCGGRMPPYLRRGAPTRISHELSSPQQKVGERCGLSPSASRTFSVRRHLQPPRPFTSLAPVG